MMHKLRKIFTNWHVILLLVVLIMAIISINPSFDSKGVAIRSITKNSSASNAGFESAKSTVQPRAREKILSINNVPINSLDDYENTISNVLSLPSGSIVRVVTSKNKGGYNLKINPKINITVLSETEVIFVNETINNKTVQKKIIINKTKEEIIGNEDLGFKVYEAPTTNLRKGLDLQGGTRVLLQPESLITEETMDLLITNMQQRLNVYGLSDVVVKKASDLSGNQFVVVEVAGANEEEVKDLLSRQGKFESKIGNTTIFSGGNDIVYVAKSGDQSGIDPAQGCGMLSDNSYSCRFRFAITLSQGAAQRQADATGKLGILSTAPDGTPLSRDNQYLDQDIDLYLDDQLVDTLKIGSDLKGRAVTDIQISGSGQGRNEQEAKANALLNMKKLQTVLVTGSLPVKLSIAKIDLISPVLGVQFINNTLFLAFVSLIAVTLLVYLRYRNISIVLPIFCVLLMEIVILLGAASFIRWNLDLAAIAAIIIVFGTGVDHLFVITDETLARENVGMLSWKEKISRAFTIILVAATTSSVAMIPLMFAGAGLLRGFAIVTIMGFFIGVIFTRSSYAAIIEIILTK